MAYTNSWDETDPDGAVVSASSIDEEINQVKKDVRERIETVIPGWSNDSEDPKLVDPTVLDFERVLLRKSAAQTHSSSGTFIDVTWDSEDFDTDSFADLGSDDVNITIPSGLGGLYVIFAHLSFAQDSTGSRGLNVEAGGDSVIRDDRHASSSTLDTKMTGVAMKVLSAADTIKMQALQDSGGSLDIIGDASAYWTMLGAIRVTGQ